MQRNTSGLTTILWALVMGCLFLIINTWLIGKYWYQYSNYDLRRIIIVAILGWSGLIMLQRPYVVQLQFRAQPAWVQLTFLTGLAFLTVRALQSHYPQFALLNLSIIALSVISMYLLADSLDKPDNQFYLLCAIGIITVSYSIYTLITVLTYQPELWLGAKPMTILSHLSAPSFANRRFLTQIMSWWLPLLILPCCLPTLPRWLKALALLNASFWWAMAMAGGSRALLLEWIVIIPMLFCYWRYSKRYLSWQIIAISLGLLIYITLYRWYAHIPIKSIPLADSDHRAMLWHLSWQFIKAHPWLGIGPGQFPVAAYPFEKGFAHPHNMLLKMAVEWGIPAALLFISVMTYALWRWMCTLTKLTQQHGVIVIGLTASIIGAGIHSLLSGIIVMPASQICLVITIGLALGLYRSSPTCPVRNSYNIIICVIVLALLGTLAITIQPQLWTIPAENNWYLQHCHKPHCVLAPALWSEGFFQLYHFK